MSNENKSAKIEVNIEDYSVNIEDYLDLYGENVE